jgi:hypothetical protein
MRPFHSMRRPTLPLVGLLFAVALGCQSGDESPAPHRTAPPPDLPSPEPGGYGPSPQPPDAHPPDRFHRGDLRWLRTFGSPGADLVQAACGDDELVVVGSFQGSVTFGAGEPTETTLTAGDVGAAAFVARFEANGALAWARELGSGPGPVQVTDCASRQGRTYVTGTFADTVVFEFPYELLQARSERDVFVVELDSRGVLVDAHTLVAGPASAKGIRCGVESGCVVFGELGASARVWPDTPDEELLVGRGERDIFLAPLEQSRRGLEHPVQLGGPGDEAVYDVAVWTQPGVLPDRGYMVAGSFDAPLSLGAGGPEVRPVGGADGLLVHLRADGMPVWTRVLGGPDDDVILAVAGGGQELFVGGAFGAGADGATYLELPDQTLLESRGGADGFVALFELSPGIAQIAGSLAIGTAGDDEVTQLVARPVFVFGDDQESVRVDLDGLLLAGHFGDDGTLHFGEMYIEPILDGREGSFVAKLDDEHQLAPTWTRLWPHAFVTGVTQVDAYEPVRVVGGFEEGAIFGVEELREVSPVNAGRLDGFVATLAP